MKSTRIPQSPSLEANKPSPMNLRGLSSDPVTKIEGGIKVEDISKIVSDSCAEDDGVALRLKDEFSEGLIASVIQECRLMISENAMTSDHWSAIGEFLSEELWEFSRLKEDLVMAERKCGIVQQKANEISQAGQSGGGDELKNRLMACAMLLAETEMRRDNLSERISMIVDEFVTQILSDLRGSAEHTGLELRLRAVFGGL
jgi:hypothetical protein